MDNVRLVAIFVAWYFVVIVMYMVANTVIFGFVSPVMDQAGNTTGNLTTQAIYNTQNTNVIKLSFNAAMFVMMLIPPAYLFIRLVLKREKTTQPAYGPGQGGW